MKFTSYWKYISSEDTSEHCVLAIIKSKKCHITFTLHVYKLTFISGFSGDGGGVSSFVSEQPLHVF